MKSISNMKGLKRIFEYSEPTIEAIFQAVEWMLVSAAVLYISQKTHSTVLKVLAIALMACHVFYLLVRASNIGLLLDPERKGKHYRVNLAVVTISGFLLVNLYWLIFVKVLEGS